METLSSLLLSAVHPRGVRFALQALVLGGAALPLRTHSARHRRVYRRPFEAGQPRRELLAGVFVVASGTVTVAVREAGEPVRFGEVTLVSSLVTFAVLFIVNEAGFYASHRALPLPQALLPACPAPHRAHDAPLSTVSFSLAAHVLTLACDLGAGAGWGAQPFETNGHDIRKGERGTMKGKRGTL